MSKRIAKNVTNEGLKGLDIRINEFGQVDFSMQLEDVNQFLNKNLEDPKLKHLQDDLHQ